MFSSFFVIGSRIALLQSSGIISFFHPKNICWRCAMKDEGQYLKSLARRRPSLPVLLVLSFWMTKLISYFCWQFTNIWFGERINYVRDNIWHIVIRFGLKEFYFMRRSLIILTPLLSRIILLAVLRVALRKKRKNFVSLIEPPSAFSRLYRFNNDFCPAELMSL